MNISTLSIKRPVLAIVMNLGIVLFGVIGFKFLGIREYPSIDPPVITVKTSYPGADPGIIEQKITIPIEKAINGISGIKSISSSSNQGSSVITIEFELNTDIEAAANDVRDKVGQVNLKGLVDLPTVTKADANSDAILSMTLESSSRSHLEVSDFAENTLAPRLQNIKGVSNVQIWGQKNYCMRISLDPQKMSARNITASDIKLALEKENVELPAGKISGNSTELPLKVVSGYHTEKDFNNLIIKSEGLKQVLLSDIGEARLGAENEETILRQSGIPMIGLGVVPQPGANYIEIADEFYKRIEQLKKDLPPDFKINVALDNTRFIRRSINEVVETLAIALLLVIVIVYLFFRDWIIAIRPLIDIPVSLIATFFVMYLMGFSINVLTLLAIVLATGLVVDDGIVVTENIFKKTEEGLSPIDAAITGSKEIIFAVISTSVTLAAVFLPIIFLQGFVGRLFQEFGIVIASAVLISAFVSLTLTPMLNAKLIRKNSKRSKFYEMTEPFFERLNQSYLSSLETFMKKRWLAFPIILICSVLIYFVGKNIPSELAPLEDRSWFRISVTAPEGSSYEYTDDFMMKLSDFIKDSIPEKKVLLTVTAPGFIGSGAVNTGFVRLKLTEPNERKRTQQQIAEYFTKKSKNFPEAKTFVIQEQTISAGGGPRGALPVQMVIKSLDFEKLKKVIPLMMDKMQKNQVFQGVDVNLKFNRPELKLLPDSMRARLLGVNFFELSQTLQLALSGQRYGFFTMKGREYQVIGQLERKDRNAPGDLDQLFVRNKVGKMIPLSILVSTKEQSSPPQLYRYNTDISATISAGLANGKTIGDGISEIRKIASETLDENFTTALTGPSRDFEESSSNVLFAFLLSLILIYLILAAQFESFIDPMIIMLTVPLAIAGALFSLWYFNQTMNIFSQIGIIMLIGLVTKNGILIVEFANKLRLQGVNKSEAAIKAASQRLRPILMTSLATALGALPIALALGAGAKSRTSMGIVIIGGLLFSLLLTLYVIPAMYTYLSGKKNEII
ncbi:MAG: efflux RND transporter permease subunit [Bacteroidota bacterium]|jgi:hydrophobe/amphiphile efflux-1 (HAE1) family protein